MENKPRLLPPIPPKRYFSLAELCALADISAEQFAAWQRTHGIVVGYGGNHYTRLDVLEIRQLREAFSPYIDAFTRNRTDAQGDPAIDADTAREQLQKVLHSLESALAR